MHGHVSQEDFLLSVSSFLGVYYLTLALMNGIAALYLWRTGKSVELFKVGKYSITTALVWVVVAIFFTAIAPLAMSGDPRLMGFVSVPAAIRHAADSIMGPVVYSIGTLGILVFLFIARDFFVKPWVAWTGLNLSLLWMGLSITDMNFAAIVTKPDNVPIVGLVFLLGFFTWLSAYQAVLNDARIARGEDPLEKLDSEKILVWPDLVYTEMICMVALTAFMILWAIGLQAPLEEPASSVKTPNPSKAPWYFLGLQEMLVYYDPWMAGVVLPVTVIFGLAAIPFMDFNKLGNGYYTIKQRRFAYLVFQFGFLELWITLIVMGTFLRGPNWNFFGFYETWDAHKVEALNNRDLSQYFWIDMLGMARPRYPDGAGSLEKIGWIIFRESPGILLTIGYLTVMPPLMIIVIPFFKSLYTKMGFLRYMLMAQLLLVMALLPLKMVLRWSFNLKYFIAIPEYLMNL